MGGLYRTLRLRQDDLCDKAQFGRQIAGGGFRKQGCADEMTDRAIAIDGTLSLIVTANQIRKTIDRHKRLLRCVTAVHAMRPTCRRQRQGGHQGQHHAKRGDEATDSVHAESCLTKECGLTSRLLEFLIAKVAQGARGKDIQVETTIGDLMAALNGGAVTKTAGVRDMTKLMERALLWLHEQQVLTLDDYSRHVIGWKLCGNMRAEDVTDTLDIALAASGCDSAKVLHKPRLLSDRAIEGAIGPSPMARGSSHIAGDLAEYLEDKGMKHVRGAPMRPQTQGKIERWHQTLKSRILLENHFMEDELETAIAAFVDHCNNHRYHESIGNLTQADV